MGYYIEVPKNKGKAEQLVELYGATILDRMPAKLFRDKAIICVVNNRPYEAAAFIYNKDELREFSQFDGRARKWLTMDWDLAMKFSGFEQ